MLQTIKMDRSVQSRVLEEVLRLTSKTTPCTEETEKRCDAFIESRREVNAQPYKSPARLLRREVEEMDVEGMQVFRWGGRGGKNQKAILYLHGGAYMNQPNALHFKMVDRFAREANAEVYFPIYPKIPAHTYKDAYPRLLALYRKICEDHRPDRVALMGDSSGGGLALGLAYYLDRLHRPQPGRLILFSPWLDVRTDYPEIDKVSRLDPTLSAWRVRKMGLAWAGSQEDLTNPYVSPLFGQPENVARISIFTGTHDILYPDIRRFDKLLDAKGVAHDTFVFEKMDHVFVAFPLPEARAAQDRVIGLLREM